LCDLAGMLARAVKLPQHQCTVAEEELPSFGQCHVSCGALGSKPEMLFELSDTAAQRRLRDTYLSSRGAKAERFGDSQKVVDLGVNGWMHR
jgi:hypothetical protein